MTNPAATRATAPVARLAVFDSLGRAEEDFDAVELARTIGVLAWATACRRALRLVKYKADPKPVRRAEGSVPRHNPRIGCGEERIVLSVGRRDCWDCWTRVLRRSAGWRRMEEVRPEQRPAEKWNIVLDADSHELAGICGASPGLQDDAYIWRCPFSPAARRRRRHLA